MRLGGDGGMKSTEGCWTCGAFGSIFTTSAEQGTQRKGMEREGQARE